ncbi:MAG TPA: hypothetical protein DCZ01_03225 [Elusimicrobia bacterium]|nr:hypothetical protein [Elusimicrobiota bacterium]
MMADDPQKQPDDIRGILSDLDSILSDIRSVGAAPKPAEPPRPTEPLGKEVPLPPAVEKRPTEPPMAVEPPKPASAPASFELKIELSHREELAPPPPSKKQDLPKPLASQAKPPLEIGISSVRVPVPAPKPPAPLKAAEPPKPTESAKPQGDKPASAPPLVAQDIPDNVPKDRIRRVAYIHTFSCATAKGCFSTFLTLAARTIAKKPIFLREVLSLPVGNSSDANAVFEKARQVKAGAILAITEEWPQAKLDELAAVCSREGVMFRSVSPTDVENKATAVDVIVDIMLLPGES